MQIKHNITLQEDELTLKGKILETKFLTGERGDNIRHRKDNKTRYISSSFSPSLTKYTMFVWGASENCDNIEVKYTYESKRQALKMLDFINKFVKSEEKVEKKEKVAKEKEVKKNWTGNKNSVFTCLGASNHSKGEREENDFYETESKAVELLLELETFDKNILEPACGRGAISKVLEKFGHNVKSTDLIDRGYGTGGIDFLKTTEKWEGSIITNAPYRYGKEFVEKALEIIPTGNKVAMFFKILFLEGKARKKLFTENPPIRIWVSSSRLSCAKNGEFDKYTSSATAYAWFIWEKGYKGDIILKHFN